MKSLEMLSRHDSIVRGYEQDAFMVKERQELLAILDHRAVELTLRAFAS